MSRPQTPSSVSPVPFAHNRAETPPSLPQELFDDLIDLIQDDLSTVATLGLVSQAWYPRSRAYLFKGVYIGADKPEERCKRLLNLLETKPLLQQCILKLTLANERRKFSWLGGWPRTSEPLAAILPLLTHLQHLTLVGNYKAHWRSICAVLREALCKTMEQPSVTQLSLSSIWGLDVEFIAKLRHLKTLFLDSFEEDLSPLSLEIGQPPAFTEEAPRLESLDIGNCGYVLRNLLAAAATPEGAHNILYPKEILVTTHNWYHWMEDAWDIVLSISAPTVLRYTVFQNSPQPLDRADIAPFPPSVLDLSYFTNLTEFRLVIIHGFIHHPNHDPIPLLLDALYTLSQSATPSKLEKIFLQFDFRDVDPWAKDEDENEGFDIVQSFHDFSQEDFWAELDEILARPAFARLKHVGFFFEVRFCKLPKEDWKEGRSRIVRAMKELDEKRAILTIDNHRHLPPY